MSIFDFPRIHFWGTQFANPGTANNNSLGPGTELTITSNTEQVQPVDSSMTDAEFRAWIIGSDQFDGAGSTESNVRAQWNYYGDMGFRFSDVSISSVVLERGKPIADGAVEPLIGAKVHLGNALLCDGNPEGFDTTQIFSEALEIIAPAAFGAAGNFVSRKPSRATTRSLNWYRNVSFHGIDKTSGGAGGASATFQSSIRVEPEDLKTLADHGPAYDSMLHRLVPKLDANGAPRSPALAALIRELARPGVCGLVVRYNLYLTYPRISDPELIAQFAQGLQTENPAIGWVLGTIAPWHAGEPESVTMGRWLKHCESYVPSPGARPKVLAPITLRAWPGAGGWSLDTINTFPEDGPEGVKYDLGTIRLGMRRATPPGEDPALNGSPVTAVATVPNDRAGFLANGGIYDVAIDASVDADTRGRLADPDWELTMSVEKPRSLVLMSETAYMVAADSAVNYLEEQANGSIAPLAAPGQADPNPLHVALQGRTPIHVWRTGLPAAGAVTLGVEQWQFTPSGVVSKLQLPPVLLNTSTITVESGYAIVALDPVDGPGVRMFRYVPPGLWPPSPITPDRFAGFAFAEFFAMCRVLPFDDFSHIKRDQLTFDLIYKHIFRYYALLLPAMTKRLDTSDPAIWASPTAARYLLRNTDPLVWDRSSYMPRTRDLSHARRLLLWRYCRKVLEDSGVQMTADDQRTLTVHGA